VKVETGNDGGLYRSLYQML